MVSSGDDTQKLCRALDDLFLERRRIHASFTVFTKLDLLLLRCGSSIDHGGGKQIMNLLVVDFQVADPEEKFPMRCFADE